MTRLFVALAALVMVVCIAAVAPAAAAPAPYNATLSLQMLHMAGAAYCSGSSVMSWSCSFCKEGDVAGFQPFGVAYNSTTDMQAYVGYEPSANAVMIAFRGTALLSIEDWLEDLNFFQVPAICPGCLVHEGFLAAYLSISDDFLKYVHIVHAQYPKADIVVAGHSLGGALAYLATVDLAINHGINVTTTYTFGQPRVGNTVFADTWAQIYLENYTSFRVTHGEDPVPHLPPKLSNFVHPETEVYYDSLNTEHQVCTGGEDPNCADQWLLAINVADHATYLGFDFVPKFLECEF